MAAYGEDQCQVMLLWHDETIKATVVSGYAGALSTSLRWRQEWDTKASATELLIILLSALIVFGPRKPDLGRSLGTSIAEFKRGMHDIRNTLDSSGRPESPGSAQPSHSAASNADGSSVQS